MEFKLQVVQNFLASEGEAKLLARRWSLPEEKICTWLSHCGLHGVGGLRPKRSTYCTQFELQVLSHQDCKHISSRQVAAIYDIRNPNQVVVWRRNLDQGRLLAIENVKEERPKMKLEGRCTAPTPREENERLRERRVPRIIAGLDPIEEVNRYRLRSTV